MVFRRGFTNSTTGLLKNASLLSIPVNLGQPLLGPDKAPELLIKNGLMGLLHASGWNVKHLSDVSTEGYVPTTNAELLKLEAKAKNCGQVGYVCKKAFDVLTPVAKTDDFLLILGGDHCIPIGTIPAIVNARKSVGVVWVDAHADINTPEGSLSGNMHGMPLGFLLDLVQNAKSFPSMSWFHPCLHPRDIVYLGLRDLDPAEKSTIKKLGIKAFSVRHFVTSDSSILYHITSIG